MPTRFPANAEAIARDAMGRIEKRLVKRYATLIRFLALHPEATGAVRGRSAPEPGSRAWIERLAGAFASAREPKSPKPPDTIPDDMVSVILVSYFGIDKGQVVRIQREHALSMGAENVVGDLLKRYIASIAEPKGWVWCSGSSVKSVDFIKPPTRANEPWTLLQVKNRDNSENSSSSAIRTGTTIGKWHRTFSRRAGSNWEAFPDETLRKKLSEEGFKAFVRDYLKVLPKP